jgi:hypothetical protein
MSLAQDFSYPKKYIKIKIKKGVLAEEAMPYYSTIEGYNKKKKNIKEIDLQHN